MARRSIVANHEANYKEHKVIVDHGPARWPFGMARVVAADYVGFSPSHFDKMVAAGKMPAPRRDGSRLIWLQDELQAALRALPTDGRDQDNGERNPWDAAA